MIERVTKMVVAILTGCACLCAQSERGSIRGTVEDATGAVVPGAKVTATNAGTGVETTTQSTGAGNYNLAQLPPGIYRVTAEQSGFKKLIQENVEVQVSGVTPLDLHMEVGQLTESVTVATAAPLLKTETTEISIDVNPKSYNDLPVTSSGGRSPEAFLFLSPGVTPGGNSPTNNFDAHINGSQTLSKELQVEGMSTQVAEVQGDPRTLTFPPDAIQEMSVMTSSYPAEFGNTGGGVERFVVKSGTNALHGNLYEFLRNTDFDARGFFNSSTSVHHENEYGGTVGGPVVIPKVYDGRNKTFFFTNLNWFKLRGGAQNSIGSVPNQAFRNGDLSGLTNSQGQLIQIYDPATTVPDGQGGFTRQPFPGNIIPANRISAVSKNILATVPLPVLGGVYNNYPASGNSVNNNHNWSIKGDEYFTSNHHLSGFWNQGTNLDNGPYSVLPHPVESTRDGTNTQKTGRLNYDWTIGPALLNSLRMGFNRQHQLLVAPETTVDWGSKLGISGINLGFPGVTYGAFTALAQNQDRIEPVSNTFLYADALSWTRGKHNLKFGIDLRRLQHNGRYPSRDAAFSFSPLETAFPSGSLRATTGNEFASFLLGNVDNGSQYINNVVVGEREWYAGLYAQDDWKFSPNLTFNLGVRWDLFTPWSEVKDRYSIMDPTLPNPAAGGIPGAYVFAGGSKGTPPFTGTSYLTTDSSSSLHNFAPRLGMAWKLTNRFVIRSAYGISYYPNGGLGGGNVTTQDDGFQTNATFQTPDSGVHPAFIWDSGFPQNYPHPPLVDAGLNVGQSAHMWWDNASLPMYKQDWNFTTQTQLTSTLVLDVSYVGSKSTRLNSGAVNINQVNPSYLSLGSLLLNNISDPSVVAAGFKPPYPGFTGSLAQALRPFPQYLGVSASQSANIGNATYNSLQTKLEKRFSKGLWLLASYSWSKTLTDANSSLGSFFSPAARDNYNRHLEKALAIYDVPTRLVVAFNYELPIGPGKPLLNKGVAGKVLGGWQVNGILSYQSGIPIQIGANNTLPLFNSGNTPNSIAGQKVENPFSPFDPAKNVLLNTSAFSIPGTNQFGSSAQVLPNARNFPVYNEDLGLMKKFFIREQTYFELRFEMFNALNRVIFGGPATNINNANFGQVTSQANGPRNGQIAGKFYF
jgi:outer membrane receptor protein involved in Fe transport